MCHRLCDTLLPAVSREEKIDTVSHSLSSLSRIQCLSRMQCLSRIQCLSRPGESLCDCVSRTCLSLWRDRVSQRVSNSESRTQCLSLLSRHWRDRVSQSQSQSQRHSEFENSVSLTESRTQCVLQCVAESHRVRVRVRGTLSSRTQCISVRHSLERDCLFTESLRDRVVSTPYRVREYSLFYRALLQNRPTISRESHRETISPQSLSETE